MDRSLLPCSGSHGACPMSGSAGWAARLEPSGCRALLECAGLRGRAASMHGRRFAPWGLASKVLFAASTTSRLPGVSLRRLIRSTPASSSSSRADCGSARSKRLAPAGRSTSRSIALSAVAWPENTDQKSARFLAPKGSAAHRFGCQVLQLCRTHGGYSSRSRPRKRPQIRPNLSRPAWPCPALEAPGALVLHRWKLHGALPHGTAPRDAALSAAPSAPLSSHGSRSAADRAVASFIASLQRWR